MGESTIGVVDIGSNTVHLLVASSNGRSLKPLVDTSESLRLGGDIDKDGALSPEKADALVATLERFKGVAAQAGVTTLHLLATQALRVATNREEVCRRISEATGLPVAILSTEQEAMLAFTGAAADCPNIGPQVVVDIGGGSMQVGIGEQAEMWDSVSLPLGAARMADHFLPNDPPTPADEASLAGYLSTVVPSALPLPDTGVTRVVGVGGTLRRTPPLLGLKNDQTFPSDGLESILGMLRGRSEAEIAEIYELKPERAGLILPAVLLLREVVKGYDFPPLVMACYGLREGAVLSLARNGRNSRM